MPTITKTRTPLITMAYPLMAPEEWSALQAFRHPTIGSVGIYGQAEWDGRIRLGENVLETDGAKAKAEFWIDFACEHHPDVNEAEKHYEGPLGWSVVLTRAADGCTYSVATSIEICGDYDCPFDEDWGRTGIRTFAEALEVVAEFAKVIYETPPRRDDC